MRFRGLAWWPWAVLTGGLATVVALLGTVGAGFHRANALAMLALLPVLGAAANWALRTSRPRVTASDAQLGAAAQALADAVRAQWSREMADSGLTDTRTLAVRWREAQARVGDHERTAGRIACAATDRIAEFAEHFRGLPHRRLVILGGPGSGKTTLAMLLVRELLEQRDPGAERDPGNLSSPSNPGNPGSPNNPVPVLLTVSSWNPRREHLDEWLRGRLNQDYPALGSAEAFGRDAAARLVADRRVLPVLDGLDELPEAVLPTALAAINAALAGGGQIILTSRAAEFVRALGRAEPVHGAAVVTAVPVRPEDAANYLRDAVPAQQSERWQAVFKELSASPRGPLATALAVPLNIWLARTVYRPPDADPAELTRFGSAQQIQDHLLDGLVPAAFAAEALPRRPPAPGVRARRDPGRWDPGQARAWLAFLAAELTRRGTADLAWWELPRALPTEFTGPTCGPVLGAVYGLAAGCAMAECGTPCFDWAAVTDTRVGALVALTGALAAASFFGCCQRRRESGAVRPLGPDLPPFRAAITRILRRFGRQLTLVLAYALVIALILDCGFTGSGPDLTSTAGRSGLRWSLGAGACAGLVLVTCGMLLTRLGAAVCRTRTLTRALCSPVLFAATALCAMVPLRTISQIVSDHSMQEPFEGMRTLAAIVPGAFRLGLAYASVLALVSGVAGGLAAAAHSARPTRFDFRPSGRLRSLSLLLCSSLTRGMLLGLVLGALLGLDIGPLLNLDAPPGQSAAALPPVLRSGIEVGVLFGLIAGASAGLMRWARTPADLECGNPRATARGDLLLTAVCVLTGALPFLVKDVLATPAGQSATSATPEPIRDTLFDSPTTAITLGVASGLILATTTAYFRFTLARRRLAAEGVLPRKLLGFLEDAHRLGVLRQVGAVYQFRHARLRQRLATEHAGVTPARRRRRSES